MAVLNMVILGVLFIITGWLVYFLWRISRVKKKSSLGILNDMEKCRKLVQRGATLDEVRRYAKRNCVNYNKLPLKYIVKGKG